MENNLERDSINVEKALKKTTEEQDKDKNDTPVETKNMNIPEEDDPPPSGSPIDIHNNLRINRPNGYFIIQSIEEQA